ncbi:MAG TPA: hypothetical protein VL282_08685 [Tepidisphaeraceae bacterium]|nr:hypothetical protein [Tepidisphaeraceae bacterium]
MVRVILGHGIRTKFPDDARTGGAGHSLAPFTITQHSFHSSRQNCIIAGVENSGFAVVNKLGQSADGSGYDHNASRPRFEHRERHSFRTAAEHEDIEKLKVRRGVGLKPYEVRTVAHVHFAGELLELGPERPVSDEHEMCCRMQCLQPRESFDQYVLLLDLRQAADGANYGCTNGNVEALAQFGTLALRAEVIGVDSVWHDSDLRFRHDLSLDRVTRNVVRNAEELIRAGGRDATEYSRFARLIMLSMFRMNQQRNARRSSRNAGVKQRAELMGVNDIGRNLDQPPSQSTKCRWPYSTFLVNAHHCRALFARLIGEVPGSLEANDGNRLTGAHARFDQRKDNALEPAAIERKHNMHNGQRQPLGPAGVKLPREVANA